MTWRDNSNNERGFRVEWRQPGEAWQSVIAAAQSTSYTVASLTSETTYEFRVCAFNNSGESPYAGPVSGQTNSETGPKPLPPSQLAAGNVTDTSIRLTWKDNSDNEQGFRVEWAADGTTWQASILDAQCTSYTVANLRPGTKYYFRVRAFNDAGSSPDAGPIAALTTGTVVLPPARPTNLQATAGKRFVDLAWNDVANNETEYRVAISRDGGCTWDNVAVLGASATSVRITDLQPGTAYRFKVRAANSAGFSDYSNAVEVRTGVEVPARPTNLRATAGKRFVDLAWNDVANNETEYRVAISRDGGRTWDNVAVLGANATSVRITDLQPGTAYRFKVRAANSAGFSDYSNAVEVRTNN